MLIISVGAILRCALQLKMGHEEDSRFSARFDIGLLLYPLFRFISHYIAGPSVSAAHGRSHRIAGDADSS